MSFESGLIESYDCRHVVMVRWNQEETNSVVPTAGFIVTFLETVGYSVGNKESIGYSPTPKNHDQFIILPMNSIDEAQRICNDSVTKGFAINETTITINPLIGLNGIRLRDGNDFIRTSQEHFNNSELLDLLMITIRLELPERLAVIEKGFELIKNGISELFESASCEMFGSFSSNVRRNGYSDIDINVESIDTLGRKGSSTVRRLNELLANPKSLINSPLTKEELHTYPHEETIKVLYRCFHENAMFRENFEIRYVPARTPILVFKSIHPKEMNVSFDVSVCNQKGVDKANLLDEFIMKDRSVDNKMKNAMLFIVHWARTNNLMHGAYPEEKLKTKTNLNSYIFNQLIIHFVQAASGSTLVHPQAKYGSRVEEYNFDTLFDNHCNFLKEFFKYYASFDFTSKAIYGKQAMQKTTLSKVHGAKITPLMMMDPMDCTHNISAKVTDDAVKLLNGLIRNTLFILKKKNFHINLLLETNQIASEMMTNKETTINVTTSVKDGVESSILTIQLPDIIQSSNDLMLLLTRVLRFNTSRNQGPNETDLCSSEGVTFDVQAKTWMGRRNKKRQLKMNRADLTPLQLDVLCSDMYHYEDRPVALLRVYMPNTTNTSSNYVSIEVIQGNVFEIRDAMHYLMDQFLINNMDVLLENGIQCIFNISSTEITKT